MIGKPMASLGEKELQSGELSCRINCFQRSRIVFGTAGRLTVLIFKRGRVSTRAQTRKQDRAAAATARYKIFIASRSNRVQVRTVVGGSERKHRVKTLVDRKLRLEQINRYIRVLSDTRTNRFVVDIIVDGQQQSTSAHPSPPPLSDVRETVSES